MAKRAGQSARKLVRAATDELGLTTPKTARRRPPARGRNNARKAALRQFRR
jgi:hypothetical protein